MELLLFLFIGMVLQWGFMKFVSHPRCEDCGAKAMPNQTAAMIKAWHKADQYENQLRSVLPLLDGEHDGSQQYEDMRAYQADQIREALEGK